MMLDNNVLRVRPQISEIGKSQDIASLAANSEAKSNYIKVAEDFQDNMDSPKNKQVSPKPTENLQTEDGVMVSTVFSPPLTPLKKITFAKKKVKDGVDILALDPSMDVEDCDSSLELILVTLSQAFQMNPKQAAALLTNNNQYLVTACIKGIKGGKYEPL